MLVVLFWIRKEVVTKYQNWHAAKGAAGFWLPACNYVPFFFAQLPDCLICLLPALLLCTPLPLHAATAPTSISARVNLEDSTRWTYPRFAAGTIFDLLAAAPDTGMHMSPGAPLELSIDFVAWLAPAQIELRVGSPTHVDLALYTAGTNGLCAARPVWFATLTDCAANVQVTVPISAPVTGRWLRLRLEPRRDDAAVILNQLVVFGARGVTNLPTWPTRAFAQAEQLVAVNATNAAAVIARSMAPTALHALARDGYPAGVFWYLLYTRALELQDKPLEAFNAATWAREYTPQRTNLSDVLPLAEVYCAQARTHRAIGWDQDAEAYYGAAQQLAVSNVPVWQECATALAELALDGGDFARAERHLRDLFVRVEQPTRAAYAMYAKTLFYNGKPRDGFDTIKECMTLYPLDAALVENDPVFALYVDRLGEATESELCGFYDALGAQLEMIPPVQGNESALALCANERTLLTRLFPFLTKEDDMARIRAIISAKEAVRAHAQAAP